MQSNPKPAGARSARLIGARVLVVDDHAFTTGLIKDVLYAAGVRQVHTARDGAEALEALRACQPHLVVTDWRMPGVDGLAFTAAVRDGARRADPRVPDPQVPIVLLSAHASTRAVETARRLGVNEVLVKPFTIAALLRRLESALARPRPFVLAEAYVGPDRRRSRSGEAAKRRIADAEGLVAIAADAGVLRRVQRQLHAIEQRPRRAPPHLS